MIQNFKRTEIVKCQLMRKGDVSEGNQIRFTAEETDNMVSRVDELIVMDQVAFVLRNKKEYVFKKGNAFSE